MSKRYRCGAMTRALAVLMMAMLFAAAPRAAAQTRVAVAAAMDSTKGVRFEKGHPRVVDGPNGSKVLRFDAHFEGHINLDAMGIDPYDYDLIKVRVKADRGAVLKIVVDNYPKRGDAAYWWVLDALRGPFDWRTIWIDLKYPEDIKIGGDKRNPWRQGPQSKAVVLSFDGSIKNLGRKAQASAKSIWLGEIRFLKKAVDLNWDQTTFSMTGGHGEDLTYTYPLTLTNKLDKAVTAKLALLPVEAKDAKASVPETVELAAGETKTVQATVTLPAAAAAKADPLYTERFKTIASAKGYEDSAVTILRSSDPIYLVVTKPIAENKLRFPLFPRPSALPADIVFFDAAMAKKLATALPPEQLIQLAMKDGIYNYSEKRAKPSAQFRKALISAAYLYDFTGERQYLDIARKLLECLPDVWAKFYAQWQAQPVRVIGSGIVARWNDGAHYTLGLGWRVAGTQRSPYQYSQDHNSQGGGMSAIMYAFDMLAPKLTPAERKRFIQGFLVPAGIQCRNGYIGDGNQQATVDAVALYAGLASRNWPMVAFTYNSQHGVGSILDWCFTDQGVHIRKGYQTYIMRPVFWIAETLYGRGIDIYKQHAQRIRQIIGIGYGDQKFWHFVEQHRLPK